MKIKISKSKLIFFAGVLWITPQIFYLLPEDFWWGKPILLLFILLWILNSKSAETFLLEGEK